MSILFSDNLIEKFDFIDECRQRLSVTDNKELDLPQIIAVGDQSSGKSSILEAISGIKLPKGQDTVTKRPIVVRMRRNDKEECIISCNGRQHHLNVSEVESKIKEVQGSEVSREPIHVEVSSPNVPPLTIIDLPGIVKQALVHQDQSIVKETKAVSMFYMGQQNSLILCVIPASTDFNTVDTLTLAEEFDKEKTRTIGVLTKVDKLADDEIQAKMKILMNISKPLEKGYYGLILTDDILSLDHRHRHEQEKEQFKKKGQLWDKCQDKLGLNAFTKSLCQELVLLIDKNQPRLKSQMEDMLKVKTERLEELAGIYDNASSQRKHLLEIKDVILDKLTAALVKGCCKLFSYQKCVDYLRKEKMIKDCADKHDTFLYGHHQIFIALYNKFDFFFKDNFKLNNAKYTVKYLQEMAEKTSTEHIPIFMSSEPFKEVVGVHLKEYEKASKECLNTCFELANLFIESMTEKDLDTAIPGLKVEFKEKCCQQLSLQYKVALERIQMIFRSESRCYTQKRLDGCKDEKEGGMGDSVITMRPGDIGNPPSIPNMAGVVGKMPTSASMNAFSPRGPKDGDTISLNGKEKAADSSSSGKKLKETLEKYIQNLISRLGDVIPNIIMLSLFEDFHHQLKKSLNTFITDEVALDFFRKSDEKQKEIDDLKKSKVALEDSLRRLRLIWRS